MLERPDWVRMSIQPTMTNNEIEFICDAIKDISKNVNHWKNDYNYAPFKNEFIQQLVNY